MRSDATKSIPFNIKIYCFAIDSNIIMFSAYAYSPKSTLIFPYRLQNLQHALRPICLLAEWGTCVGYKRNIRVQARNTKKRLIIPLRPAACRIDRLFHTIHFPKAAFHVTFRKAAHTCMQCHAQNHKYFHFRKELQHL